MRAARTIARLLLAGALAGCADTGPGPDSDEDEVPRTVAGTMSFVLGGTSGAASPAAAALGEPASLAAGAEYIVSPRKAKITFTSVVFRGATGETLGESLFSGCAVTYDRSLTSGSTLLDCPFTVPVGEIHQMAVYFDRTLQVLVSDAQTGIYTDPAAAGGFSTTAPAGGAQYASFRVTIGDGPSRATPIVFPAALTIAAGSSPNLYVTTDMIHTIQLKVDPSGATLSPTGEGNDPVHMFGGLGRGSSQFYSDATTIETIPVQGFRSVRIFYDQAGSPLYLIGPSCDPDPTIFLTGPKGAWATPPIGGTIGGWLGRDANRVLAWALPTTTSYTTYSQYLVMPERTTVGQTTVLSCKVTTSPPPPADGRTYASGAPPMAGPTRSTTMRLLAK